MKSFRFPLESLRTLRKQKERAAQQRYARSLFACKAAATQLEKAVKELDAGRDMLMRELTNGVPAARIVNLRTWCMALAFQEMTAAMRDREGLDRFYDKARRVHAQEYVREEQKNFDELAVQLNGAG